MAWLINELSEFVGGICREGSLGLCGYHHSLLLSLDKHMPQGLIRHLILHLDLFLVSSLSSYTSKSCILQISAPLYREKSREEAVEKSLMS